MRVPVCSALSTAAWVLKGVLHHIGLPCSARAPPPLPPAEDDSDNFRPVSNNFMHLLLETFIAVNAQAGCMLYDKSVLSLVGPLTLAYLSSPLVGPLTLTCLGSTFTSTFNTGLSRLTLRSAHDGIQKKPCPGPKDADMAYRTHTPWIPNRADPAGWTQYWRKARWLVLHVKAAFICRDGEIKTGIYIVTGNMTLKGCTLKLYSGYT